MKSQAVTIAREINAIKAKMINQIDEALKSDFYILKGLMNAMSPSKELAYILSELYWVILLSVSSMSVTSMVVPST